MTVPPLFENPEDAETWAFSVQVAGRLVGQMSLG
jgi:hypothetical protein